MDISSIRRAGSSNWNLRDVDADLVLHGGRESIHRRPAAWAETGVNKKRMVQALAGRSGKAFAAWAGDSNKWGRALWESYEGLKHEPSFTLDTREIVDGSYMGPDDAVGPRR